MDDVLLDDVTGAASRCNYCCLTLELDLLIGVATADSLAAHTCRSFVNVCCAKLGAGQAASASFLIFTRSCTASLRLAQHSPDCD